ncbi:MAG TPA: transglutaminase-like domain-containing protein [Actinomycetota bacterium]|nr:transglutaminase-like domain-containing protein [Actinomycetota bacterium]
MGSRMEALGRFAQLAALPEPTIDLAEAALLIGAAGEPGIEPSRWLAELDGYAAKLSDLDALRRRLFVELAFRGDTRNYYDAENSFLHRVIARRLGIPITLSVLAIEVGRRAGIALDPVGMPGHFLVGIPGEDAWLDAFAGGELLDLAGCEARFRASTGTGPEVTFGPHLLPVVGPFAVLSRMLANLGVVYQVLHSGADLEWVARMRLALPDAGTPEVLALASALELQGKFLEAARELEARAASEAHDGEELRGAALRLRSRCN